MGKLPTDVIDGHLRRRDFSRWVLEVFADRELAGEIARVEAAHAKGHITDPAAKIARRVAARYEIPVVAAGSDDGAARLSGARS